MKSRGRWEYEQHVVLVVSGEDGDDRVSKVRFGF